MSRTHAATIVGSGFLAGFCVAIIGFHGASYLVCEADCRNDCPLGPCGNPPCCDHPPCCNGDVNGDGGIDLGDAVYILQYLFAQGPEIAPIACGSCRLPATGQTQCYDMNGNVVDCRNPDCPGQDGFYQAGCPMEGRFVDNGDGTITDQCTGLMWQQATADINGDGVIDPAVQGGGPTSDTPTWQVALTYCENLQFAGYSDWRLPNIRELESTVNYGLPIPDCDPAFDAEPWRYWSSSSYAANPAGTWIVPYHKDDKVRFYLKTDGWCFVRAVRDAR